MGLLYETQFIAADATSLDALTLDGKQWTVKGGGQSASYQINANTAYLSAQGTNTRTSAAYFDHGGGDDYRLVCELHTHASNDNRFGIVARASVGNDNTASEEVYGYFAVVAPDNNPYFGIYSNTAGGWSALVTDGGGRASELIRDEDYSMELEVDGNVKTFRIGGMEVTESTNTDHTTGSQCGIGIAQEGVAYTADTTRYWDKLQVFDLDEGELNSYVLDSAQNAQSTQTALTITHGFVDVQVDDVFLVIMCSLANVDHDDNNGTEPFTFAGEVNQLVTGDNTVSVFYRVANDTTPQATFDFLHDAGITSASYSIHAYHLRHVDVNNIIDIAVAQANSNGVPGSTNRTMQIIEPSRPPANNSLLVGVGAGDQTNLTERLDNNFGFGAHASLQNATGEATLSTALQYVKNLFPTRKTGFAWENDNDANGFLFSINVDPPTGSWTHVESDTDSSAGSTTPEITMVAAPDRGDLVVAMVHCNSATANIAPVANAGADWVELRNDAVSGETCSVWIGYKIANGSEPATQQWSQATGESWRTTYHVFDCGGGIPVLDLPLSAAATGLAQSGMDIDATDARTVAANSLSIGFGIKDDRDDVSPTAYDTVVGDTGWSNTVGNEEHQAACSTTKISVDGETLVDIRVTTDSLSGSPGISWHVSFRFTFETPAVSPPTISFTTGNTPSALTSHNITMPTCQAGDLLLIIFASDSDGVDTTITKPADFTDIKGSELQNAVARLICAKVAISADSGATKVVTTDDAEQAAWIVGRVPAAEWEGTLASIEAAATAANGSGTLIDPPPITASWGAEPNLFIAVGASDRGDYTVNGYPFPDNQTSSANGNTAGAHAMACTQPQEIATIDPGTFEMSLGDGWIADTLVIRPSTGGVSVDDVANSGETPGAGSETWSDGATGNVISGSAFI